MMDMHKQMKKREAKGELKVDGDIVDEEEKLRDDEARERRREDRDRREREEKERRRKERERRDREQRERDLRERRRKERENPTRKSSRSRSRDRRETKDDKKAGSDDEKKDDKDKSSTQERFKQRAIQKQFMDLLVKSRIVTSTSTFKDLERQLGDKDEWKACDPETREDLANEFIECIKGIG